MKTRIAPALALIVLVSGGILFARGPAVEAETSAVAEKAARFGNRPGIELAEVPDGQFAGLGGLGQYRDKATGDDYVWDRAGGYVRHYAKRSTYGSRGRGTPISASDALRAAEGWARRCYDGGSVDGMRSETHFRTERDSRAPVGAMTKNYEGCAEWEVEFRRYVGDVRTFDHFTVVLDAVTGEVLRVDQDCAVVSVDLEPRVNSTDATSIGAQRLGLPVSCCTTSSLEVVRRLEGEQSLAWIIGFRTGDSAVGGSGEVVVDANTGRVLGSGRSW